MDDKKTFLINAAYYGSIALVVVAVIKYLLPVLIPFVIAWIVAIVLLKPAAWLSAKTGIAKAKIAALFTAVFYALFTCLIVISVSKFVPFLGEFFTNLPGMYQAHIKPFVDNVSDKMSKIFDRMDPAIGNHLETVFASMADSAQQSVSGFSVTMVKKISEYAVGIPSLVVKIIVTVVATFFLACGMDGLKDFCEKMLPEKWISKGGYIKDHGFKMIKTYIKSYSILMGITFTELLIGFLILGVPYAGWIALGIAIFDILPVLGTGGILIPWIIVMCILKDYSMAVGLLILYIVITIIRNMLEPRIVGKQIGLPPFITLIAMFTGVGVLGVPGLILLPMGLSIYVSIKREEEISKENESKENAENYEEQADGMQHKID